MNGSAVLVLWILVSAEGFFTPLVEVQQGKLRGLRSVSGQNRFYGIPYARSERFKPPTDPLPWDGIFSAVNRFGSCAQTVSIITSGSEDCLALDVYTPETSTPSHRLPVLVFIHGGAYYYGTKLHYDPEFLVTKNVVVVIINYRVGVLGFLCVNGIANLGLKDQIAALKWIQRNIASFGGDPENVTVSGQSAGSAAAGMLALSKSSKGLFHKAILMSGSPFSVWAFNQHTPHPAFEDARKISDSEVISEEDVFNVFANASLADLLAASHDVSLNSRYFKYTPCDDSNFTDPFFHDSPYNAIKTGQFEKTPVLMGFTSREGILFYGLHNDETLRDFDINFDEKLPSIFSWCSENDRQRISEKIRQFYFGDRPINRKTGKEMVQYYSDWVAYATALRFSEFWTKYSGQPVYNYMFSYEGDRNFAKFIFGSRTRLRGASHSDDIFYVFKPAGLSLLLSSEDKLLIDRLTTMLTNFMKYGDPTPRKTRLLPVRWSASTANSTLLMTLDRRLTVSEASETHQGRFLGELLAEYGKRGFVPFDSQELCNIY